MHARLALALSAFALLLCACQTPEERLLGWINDSRAAGRPLLIFVVRADPAINRPNYTSTASVALVNTGTQPLTNIRLRMQPYAGGKPRPGSADHPSETEYDMASTIPAGGIPVSNAMSAAWNMGDPLADCLRISEIDITLADGSMRTITGSDLDLYQTPAVNRHCAPNWGIPEGELLQRENFPGMH
jgi:hypothetical protein